MDKCLQKKFDTMKNENENIIGLIEEVIEYKYQQPIFDDMHPKYFETF